LNQIKAAAADPATRRFVLAGRKILDRPPARQKQNLRWINLPDYFCADNSAIFFQ